MSLDVDIEGLDVLEGDTSSDDVVNVHLGGDVEQRRKSRAGRGCKRRAVLQRDFDVDQRGQYAITLIVAATLSAYVGQRLTKKNDRGGMATWVREKRNTCGLVDGFQEYDDISGKSGLIVGCVFECS